MANDNVDISINNPVKVEYCSCNGNIPSDWVYKPYLDKLCNNILNDNIDGNKKESRWPHLQYQSMNIIIDKFKSMYTSDVLGKDGNFKNYDTPLFNNISQSGDNGDFYDEQYSSESDCDVYLDDIQCSICNKPIFMYTKFDYKLFDNWIDSALALNTNNTKTQFYNKHKTRFNKHKHLPTGDPNFSAEGYTTPPPEVTTSVPLTTTFGLADSSSNLLSLKGKATLGDRGDGTIVGLSGDKKPHNDNKPHHKSLFECGDEYKTSSGSGKPENDLWEFEGQSYKEAVCKTKDGSDWTSGGTLTGKTYPGRRVGQDRVTIAKNSVEDKGHTSYDDLMYNKQSINNDINGSNCPHNSKLNGDKHCIKCLEVMDSSTSVHDLHHHTFTNNHPCPPTFVGGNHNHPKCPTFKDVVNTSIKNDMHTPPTFADVLLHRRSSSSSLEGHCHSKHQEGHEHHIDNRHQEEHFHSKHQEETEHHLNVGQSPTNLINQSDVGCIVDVASSILMSSEEAMLAIVENISPGENCTNEKNQLFESLKRFLQYCLGDDTVVHLTGSTAYDIDIDYSDITSAPSYSDLDIVLLSKRYGGDPRTILQKVYCELKNMQQTLRDRNTCPKWILADSNIKLVESAKVPIVIIETKRGLFCDISVNTLYPLLHTELFKNYINEHTILRPLMRIIKHWLILRGIPSMKEGGFPSILWMSLFCNAIDTFNDTIPERSGSTLTSNSNQLLEWNELTQRSKSTDSTPNLIINNSTENYNNSTPEVTVSVPLASAVGLADSSSNYPSIKSEATPGDRGEDEGSHIGPQVEPVADQWEAEGEVNKEADGRTSTTIPESDLRKVKVQLYRDAVFKTTSGGCNNEDDISSDRRVLGVMQSVECVRDPDVTSGDCYCDEDTSPDADLEVIDEGTTPTGNDRTNGDSPNADGWTSFGGSLIDESQVINDTPSIIDRIYSMEFDDIRKRNNNDEITCEITLLWKLLQDRNNIRKIINTTKEENGDSSPSNNKKMSSEVGFNILSSLEKCFQKLSYGTHVIDVVNSINKIKSGIYNTNTTRMNNFCRNLIKLIEMEPNVPHGTWLVYYYELNRAKEYILLYTKRLELLVTLLACLRFISLSHSNQSLHPPHEVTSTEGCTSTPPEVTVSVPLASAVGLADSSSNYPSIKSEATPGDRGEDEGSHIGPQVEPVADLWEAEGQLNREATTASGKDCRSITSGGEVICKTANGGLDSELFGDVSMDLFRSIMHNIKRLFGYDISYLLMEGVSIESCIDSYINKVCVMLRLKLNSTRMDDSIKLIIYHIFQQFKSIPFEIFEKVYDNIYSIPVAIEPPIPIHLYNNELEYNDDILYDDSGWYIVILQGKLLIVKVIKTCIEWDSWWSKEFVSRRDTRSVFHGFIYRQLKLDYDIKRQQNLIFNKNNNILYPSILIKRGSLVLFNPCDLVSKLHVLKINKNEQNISNTLYSTDFYTGNKCLYLLPGFEVNRIQYFEDISNNIKTHINHDFRNQILFCKICGVVIMKRINEFTDYKISQRKLKNAKSTLCNQKYMNIYKYMEQYYKRTKHYSITHATSTFSQNDTP